MVYFIQEGSNGAIKIGFTDKNVTDRLKQLQTGNPRQLHLLKVIDGNLITESTLHNLFIESRLIGEWFAPTKQLYDFIYNNNEYKEIRIDDIYKLSEQKKTIKEKNKNICYEGIDVAILFLNSYVKFDDESYILSSSLYKEYVAWCKNNSIKHILNNANFGKVVAKTIGNIKTRITINGLKQCIYNGIKII